MRCAFFVTNQRKLSEKKTVKKKNVKLYSETYIIISFRI
jgi:hypothetical protein